MTQWTQIRFEKDQFYVNEVVCFVDTLLHMFLTLSFFLSIGRPYVTFPQIAQIRYNYENVRFVLAKITTVHS